MGVKRRMGRSRALVITVVALLAAGLVWGLGSAVAGSESPSPAAGKTVLHLGWTREPDNLNPFIGWGTPSYEVWALNYDLLVGFRPSDMANVPGIGLATAWETSPDGKVWTFTITDKATWQDGEPLTASDVAFTYNYCITNKMSMFIDYLTFITKVEATDATHVVFTCSKPKANMLGLWIPILPEHVWSKIKPADAEKAFKNPPPVVGSGPFQCVEWKRGSFVRMVANKNYWKGAPKVDEIVFQTYQNADTMTQDLKSGAIAAVWDIPEAQFRALSGNPDIKPISCVTIALNQLGMNCYTGAASMGNPVLRDVKFRRALNYAIDKDKILAVAYGGYGRLGTSLIQSQYYAPNSDYHWEPPADVQYTYDPARAKSELDAAGYTDTNGDGIRDYKGKPIELRLWSREQSISSQSAGKFIAGSLQAIGLKIDYSVMDENAIGAAQTNFTGKNGDVYAPDFDLFLWGWGGDADPNYILSVMTTDAIGSWSDCAWSNEEYDRLFLEQQTTIDLQKRIAIVHRMQEIIYDESPYIVLVYPNELEAYNQTQFTGWQRSLNNKGKVWFDALPGLYMNIQKAEVATGGGGSSTGLIVAAVAAVAVVLIVVVLLVRRRGRRSEVEA
ncbi:MAG: ABC transporter substrate-binding protein [Actinobacteria bacterium]|nr:ABC transporter substrate-binding protein [Actinomycetota bacterium]